MSERTIPYGRQSIDESDVSAVTEVLRSDFLTTGPAVVAFENDLAEFTGTRYAVAVNSGTAALHTMYFAAGIGSGDEVITSPLTFAATANAALYLGATVRFADIDPATGNIDPATVAALITPRTRLVVAVDFAGHPADYRALGGICQSHGVPLVADAAHSLGAEFHGQPVGILAHASAMSFHPVKHITTGEGGAVVTSDPELAKRAARFRTHGITKDPADLPADAEPWYQEQIDLGFNYRLTDVLAALGRSQLHRLAQFVQRRREIAARYLEAFADLDALELPAVLPGVEPSWHLFVVRVREASQRREFFATLKLRGLGVQVHYIPVYRHPYYRDLGYPSGLCPVAEDFSSRAVSLPIYPLMDDADVDRVIDEVRTAAARE